MESAGKTLEERELSEAMRERGLGTPATRAAIIELLVGRGYIERRKKQLVSTDVGRHVVAAVAAELRGAELTGRSEAYLKRTERCDGRVDRFMESIEGFVSAVVGSIKRGGIANPSREGSAREAGEEWTKNPMKRCAVTFDYCAGFIGPVGVICGSLGVMTSLLLLCCGRRIEGEQRRLVYEVLGCSLAVVAMGLWEFRR